MTSEKLLEKIESGQPITDELFKVGTNVLIEVVKGLIASGGNKKKRIEKLEARMQIMEERLTRLEIF